jgi:gliding motility-associated lipoprotein GldJ
MRVFRLITLAVATAFILSSCSFFKKGGDVSPTTGWGYNDSDNGGFDVALEVEQATGPGLVLIEGGAFTMGRVEQDVMYEWNNLPRRVTLPSFYMDQTEICNVDYREYLYWVRRVYVDLPEVYMKALPDTLVWRRRLAYNEPYVEYYLRHPAYNKYPVVGVSWLQADAYCTWRTDRVNEQILIDEGFLELNPNQVGDDNFNTESYYAGQYEGQAGKKIESMNPNGSGEGRNVTMSDGIMLPRYMLPTEAEWEYAALAIVGNSIDERIYNRKLYPWSGHYLRNPDKASLGQFAANFQRGRGDMMGIAGYLNDNAAITAPVDAYWPNDFDLYCMAGNVNEWVRDVYRPMSSADVEGFRPFRGNVFQVVERDADGAIAEKDSLGRIKYRNITDAEALGRVNYQKSDNINYSDGDVRSRIEPDWNVQDEKGSAAMYYQGKGETNEGMTSLINDKARVYKGGGWRDRAYWLVPGTRRFLDEGKASDDIGFRCSMIRVGSTNGL